MGYREQIKKAKSLEEAHLILREAEMKVSAKALRRCRRAFEQLPFTKVNG